MGAVSLFAAVSAAYLLTWYWNPSMAEVDRTLLAQSVAFATWMLGHIFLAFNFRSDRVPLARQGLLSNKLMLVWALIVVVTLAVGTNLPFVNESLRITSLGLQEWALVVGVAFAATFWMELKKLLKF